MKSKASLITFDAGYQRNSSMASCSKSVALLIMVVLPMSKNSFMAAEEGYIESVAATAGVVKENVKILSVEEISTRAFKTIALRMLLGTSVSVMTSVLLASGQQTSIENQSVLNANLVQNGLPSGTLTVQYTTPPAGLVTAAVTTPSPAPLGNEAGSQTSSNIPVGAIVGGAVGLFVIFVCWFLVCRKQNRWHKTPLNSCLNTTLVTQVPSQGRDLFD